MPDLLEPAISPFNPLHVDHPRAELIVKHRLYSDPLAMSLYNRRKRQSTTGIQKPPQPRGQYLVKWTGKPSIFNTWEFPEYLVDSDSLIQAYWRRVGCNVPDAFTPGVITAPANLLERRAGGGIRERVRPQTVVRFHVVNAPSPATTTRNSPDESEEAAVVVVKRRRKDVVVDRMLADDDDDGDAIGEVIHKGNGSSSSAAMREEDEVTGQQQSEAEEEDDGEAFEVLPESPNIIDDDDEEEEVHQDEEQRHDNGNEEDEDATYLKLKRESLRAQQALARYEMEKGKSSEATATATKKTKKKSPPSKRQSGRVNLGASLFNLFRNKQHQQSSSSSSSSSTEAASGEQHGDTSTTVIDPARSGLSPAAVASRAWKRTLQYLSGGEEESLPDAGEGEGREKQQAIRDRPRKSFSKKRVDIVVPPSDDEGEEREVPIVEKKKRGRPPKSAKPRRGRPPKAKAVQHQPSANKKKKKKKKKNGDEVASGVPKKRGPGRPRKNPENVK